MFKKTALFSHDGFPYFGNQNPTLGSVVPLAIFTNDHDDGGDDDFNEDEDDDDKP